jgi:hypothetical protein
MRLHALALNRLFVRFEYISCETFALFTIVITIYNTLAWPGVDWVNISDREFFSPSQKLTGDQRFGHKYTKKKKL